MTHHCDEHVYQDDDDGDVVERKEKSTDALDYRRGRIATGEAAGIYTAVLL